MASVLIVDFQLRPPCNTPDATAVTYRWSDQPGLVSGNVRIVSTRSRISNGTCSGVITAITAVGVTLAPYRSWARRLNSQSASLPGIRADLPSGVAHRISTSAYAASITSVSCRPGSAMRP